MLFIFKQKPIHLDCFTDKAGVYEHFPIVNGSKCMPDWWKELGPTKFNFRTMVQENTMKTCVGFHDFYTKAVCIRLWSDLAIKLVHQNNQRNYTFQFSDMESEMEIHAPSQYGRLVSDEFQNFKLSSPWLFFCKDDIYWGQIGNPYAVDLMEDSHILPGVVSFKYQNATNMQLFVKYGKNNSVVEKTFKHNTPLCNILPMSERPVVIHNHLVSPAEWSQKANTFGRISFGRSYLNSKKIRQEKESESKCPFHWK